MFKGRLQALLYVQDLPRSVDFYRALGFGFKGYWNPATQQVAMDWKEAGQPNYCEVTVVESGVGLHLAEPGRTGTPLSEHHVEVDNADTFCTQLKGKRLDPSPVADTPWGWRMFHVADPDGHVWNFFTPKTK